MSDVSLMRIANALEAISVSLEKMANPEAVTTDEDKLKEVYHVTMAIKGPRLLDIGHVAKLPLSNNLD